MIIVTGGAGFIGSNIASRLAAKGGDVVACDRFGHAAEAKWTNLNRVDLADLIAPEALFDFLSAHWRAIRAVVHMGAISATTETDVDLIVQENFELSKKLWSWCAQRRKPLIYASSAATYGDGAQGFVDDNSRAAALALQPLNAYGWSKKVFDLYALRQAEKGFAPPRWAGLRFFNVYGPNEQHKGGQKSVVAHMFPRARAGEIVRLFKSHNPQYADGKQLRDFIYVRDCVDVVEWLLESDVQAGIVNVGTGQARAFLDLATAVFDALGKPAKIEFVDTPVEIRDKYQYFTQASLDRLRGLGFAGQFTPLEAGVRDYVQDLLARG